MPRKDLELRAAMRRLIRRFGFDIVRYTGEYPPDLDVATIAILDAIRGYTRTTAANTFALLMAIEYLQRSSRPGHIVECGVWKGGSMMAAALALLRSGGIERELYLFDTFSGMDSPGLHDIRLDGVSASDVLERSDRMDPNSTWCAVSMDQVQAVLNSTGYPSDLLHFIPGRVQDTVPQEAPDQIALLRLDTDWYDSTRHELEHLFPRIVPGGVLIIDDYGCWKGARKATDEYFARLSDPPLLMRVDYTARVAVIQGHE